MVSNTANPQFNFDPEIFLSHITHRSGVYQMCNADGKVIYVGKAKDLQKRLASYFRPNLPIKTARLMAAVRDISTTATANEAEALLLENNLIKTHQPKYNILLRDDKSYPYIKISAHKYPRVQIFRRGGGNISAVSRENLIRNLLETDAQKNVKSANKKDKNAQLFGPYPSVTVAKFALEQLQKIFHLRSCPDSEFANRSRPCLQYQIKRCNAPCLEYISVENYRADLQSAADFLRGENKELLNSLQEKMFDLSEKEKYEEAAEIRDQIRALQKLNNQSRISSNDDELDADYLAVNEQYGEICVQALFFRSGEQVGSENYFPKIPEYDANSEENNREEYLSEILEAFIGQYYFERIPAGQIVAKITDKSKESLEEYLSLKRNKRVKIINKPRAEKKDRLTMAEENAKINLLLQIAAKLSMENRFLALATELKLHSVPTRIECSDISHFQGEYTVASCVVFDQRGAVKRDYRRYKISDITPGDDFAAMRQVIYRRFSRLKKEQATMPDIFFVDGGKGQLKQAMEVFEELNITGVQLIGVAKGEKRKRGLEVFWFPSEEIPRYLAMDSQAMQLIVQIRDEAHRFAITGHRKGRDKKVKRSVLENIDGVGNKRRRVLLNHFGGIKEIYAASIEEIARVEGISAKLAREIYEHLHSN